MQYPDFLFPGTTHYSTEPAPADLVIHRCIHSMNPFNWIKIGRRIRKEQPDLIVVRYWLPLMGPCLGTLLRIAKGKSKTRVVCIADNIIPHEKRVGDRPFAKYFAKAVDAFIDQFGLHSLVDDNFQDSYRGQYDSKADYAESYVSDCYVVDLPSFLEIDWEASFDNMDVVFSSNGYVFNKQF
jgi:hypothetical protein